MADQAQEPIQLVDTDDEPSEKSKAAPSPALFIFLIIPLLGIFVALLMVALESQPEPTTTNPEDLQARAQSLIDFPAPQFEITDMDGNKITLEDYAGRTVFLNFWQTTCPPCIRELPAFADFADSQGDDGAAILAINFDETTDDVQSFFVDNDIPFVPVALDPDSTVRRSYGVEMIPTTFVVDKEGVIRFMKLGEMSFEEMEGYVTALESIEGDGSS